MPGPTTPDGFFVTLLGTGCPVVSTERYGAATLVECASRRLLFDTGSGVTQRLVGAGLTGADIDAIFFTHIHSDHMVDLYQVIISSWHQNRDRPQVVYGPPGTRRFVEETMATWREERELRIAFEKRKSTTALSVETIEFSDETPLITEDGLTVTPVLVQHQPVEPAFGFVIEANARKFVLSGDTCKCDNLIAASGGADLLVHEVLIHRGRKATGLSSAEGLANVESYHTASTEVGEVAAEAGVKALALTHIAPPDTDREALIGDVRQAYDGPVFVGEDLMRFDLMTRTVKSDAVVLSY